MLKSNSDANREHFTEAAKKYDNFMSYRVGHEISSAMLQYPNITETEPPRPAKIHTEHSNQYFNRELQGINKDIFSDKTTVLDFACGTGNVSMGIAPHVKQVVGVDITQEMLDIFNHKVQESTLFPGQVKGIEVNLFEEDSVKANKDKTPVEFGTFDVAVASLAYHHLDDIDQASRTLAGQVRPGGHVYVVDLARASDLVIEQPSDVVPHRGGFTEAEMEETFKKAGLTNIKVQVFNIPLWASDSHISRFQEHHIMSAVEGDSNPPEGTQHYIHGVRFYDNINVDGELYYLIRKRLFIAVGQRPN